MGRKRKASELEDEMRAEYDLSTMKFVSCGIYAERYSQGVKFVLLNDTEIINDGNARKDQVNEQPRNISDSTKRRIN
jgi:hypothetical protein